MTSYDEVKRLAKEIDVSLKATDKRFRNSVKLVTDEGTVLLYENAFLLKKENWLLLFTEHHGYNVFCEDDLLHYSQYKRIGVTGLDGKKVPERVVYGNLITF